MDAVALCRATLEEHSKSFSLAARLLPPRCRDDAAVVYAWCRRADDAVDEVPAEEQSASLLRLRAELERSYSGERLDETVLRAFRVVTERRAIPRLYPDELLAGMEMDVVGGRYPDLDALLLYCHRVAGVVGLMMCHVLGLREERALIHAAHLGWAMQLTNICRDVEEDWGRGRVYLPADRLAAHGVILTPDGGRFPASAAAGVALVVRELLEEADGLYRSGVQGLLALDLRSAFAVDVARRVYAGIGDALARQKFDVLGGRAYVSEARKLAHVASAGIASVRALRRRVRVRVRLGPAEHPPRDVVSFAEVRRAARRLG